MGPYSSEIELSLVNLQNRLWFFSLIIVFLLFSIISTRGDFIVYFGYSCLGSTGLRTNKHEAVGLFLLFPHFY